jgi:hypothetical protein
MGVLCSVNISYVGLNFLLYYVDNFYFYFLFYATIERNKLLVTTELPPGEDSGF